MLKTVIAATQRLAQMDPQDEACDRTAEELLASASQISEQMREAKPGWGKDSMKEDLDRMHSQVKELHAAAEEPAKAYGRVLAITAGLGRAIEIARRPQNAAVRPRLAQIVDKVAGVFAEIDTVEDLDKSLEQIEKAVHGLYGDQSKNSTFYFDRRGKGHQSKGE